MNYYNSEYVKPAVLPSMEDQFVVGDICKVTGWGAYKVKQKR